MADGSKSSFNASSVSWILLWKFIKFFFKIQMQIRVLKWSFQFCDPPPIRLKVMMLPIPTFSQSSSVLDTVKGNNVSELKYKKTNKNRVTSPLNIPSAGDIRYFGRLRLPSQESKSDLEDFVCTRKKTRSETRHW